MIEESNFTHMSLFCQKEELQVYQKYCQNKPRSEVLWRQCGDSLFFQVTHACTHARTHARTHAHTHTHTTNFLYVRPHIAATNCNVTPLRFS